MRLVSLSTVGQLPADAAASYERMRIHALRDGVDLRPTSAADAHRTRPQQERLFFERYVPRNTGTGDRRVYQGRSYWRLPGVASAAVPGTSNHGFEDPAALDLTGLGGFSGEGYRWLAKHGVQYGWVNPDWARRPRAGATPEPWHWEYSRSRDQHRTTGSGGSAAARPTPPTSEEDTMSAAGEARIIELLEGITIDARDGVREGRARDKKIDGVVIDARDSALGARRLPGITIDARDGVLGNRQILAEVAGLRVAVAALASKAGLDPKAITAAVDAGVTSALARVETTVTVKPEGGR